MKTRIFLSATAGIALLLFSCKKESSAPVPNLTGTYTGKTTSASNRLEEIFTSPTESHFEWVSDSFVVQPDTLIVVEISADSFALKGSAAQWFSSDWRTYAYNESAGTTTLSFDRHIALSGYYSRHLTLTFDVGKKTLTTGYTSDSETPPSHVQISFDGTK